MVSDNFLLVYRGGIKSLKQLEAAFLEMSKLSGFKCARIYSFGNQKGKFLKYIAMNGYYWLPVNYSGLYHLVKRHTFF